MKGGRCGPEQGRLGGEEGCGAQPRGHAENVVPRERQLFAGFSEAKYTSSRAPGTSAYLALASLLQGSYKSLPVLSLTQQDI